ncbi:hypothetical protein AGMMS50293_04010 [Spirochaetia bacterium]|nr:hypothetical protein AGMMS50293_04010 [Spirochaetia bacterium]
MTDQIENRQIRIFISSTFRDMMGERDYLVTKVFPALRRYCEERDVSLFELDLRWGISEEESKQGKVVDICLKEIQKTTPFFIGLLGERYGWIPNTDERKTIAANTGVFEEYPWITAELDEGTSITEIEIQEGVLRAKKKVDAYFYFRSPTMEVSEDFKEPVDSHAAKMLGELKAVLRKQQDYPVRDYDSIENLGSLVEQDFKALVDKLWPQGALSPLEKERLEQRTFLKSRTGVYVPPAGYTEKIDAFVQDADAQALVITGDSGMGKSALLANWIQNRAVNDNEKIIYHFIGASRSEGDYRKITERLINEVRDIYGSPVKDETMKASVSDSKDKLKETLQNLVFSIGFRRRLIIVLDGVDQLFDIDHAKLLNWFPYFHRNIRVIYSAPQNDPAMEVFARRGYEIVTVKPLPFESRKALITEYLRAYAKSLLPAQIQRIAGDKESENTLALRTLLDELRVFGVHEQIDAQIDRYLAAPDLESFFGLILERLESIYNYDDTNFVKDALSLIAVSRSGLSETEILELSGAAPLYWSQLYNAIAGHVVTRNGLVSFSHNFIRDAVQKRYLPDQNTVSGYRLRIVTCVESPAASPNRKYHELPHQLYELKEWEKLYNFLLDLEVFEFLYEKDPYELGKYWRALQEESKEHYSLEKYGDLMVSEKSSESLAVLFSNIGYALINILDDHYSLALKFALKAQAIREDIMANQPDTVTVGVMREVVAETALSYNHIGAIYYLLGDYPAALEQYQKALTVIEEKGLGHRGFVSSYNGIGDLYYSTGHYQEALEQYQYSKEYLLNDTPDMAAYYYKTGNVYKSLGDYMAALDNHRQGLAIRKEAFGENHPDTALSYFGIGEVFYSIDAYGAAREWYQKAWAIREQLFGTKHRLTAEALFYIGRTYSAQNDCPKALEYYLRALEIREEVLGENHPDTVVAYNNTGSVYYKSGDYQKALEYHCEALAIWKQLSGNNHADTAFYYTKVAADHEALEDYSRALDNYRQALAIYETVLGKDHPDTKNVQDKITAITHKKGV